MPTNAHNNTIVLDLDGTLVYSTENPKNVSLCDFKVQTVGVSGGEETIWIKKGPNVEQLLCNLAENYQVAVFTAAPHDYADQVLDCLDLDYLISKRFYNTHLTLGYKHLSVVNVSLSNVLIVDDQPYLIARDQDANTVPISSFDIKSYPRPAEYCTEDDTLLKLSMLLTQVLNPHANDIVQELKYKSVLLLSQDPSVKYWWNLNMTAFNVNHVKESATSTNNSNI